MPLSMGCIGFSASSIWGFSAFCSQCLQAYLICTCSIRSKWPGMYSICQLDLLADLLAHLCRSRGRAFGRRPGREPCASPAGDRTPPGSAGRGERGGRTCLRFGNVRRPADPPDSPAAIPGPWRTPSSNWFTSPELSAAGRHAGRSTASSAAAAPLQCGASLRSAASASTSRRSDLHALKFVPLARSRS
jgi:hypothetical protein